MYLSQIHELYDYNYWANQRLLTTAAQVDPAQLQAPAAVSFGSLHGTLVHTMSAEWLWRLRIQDGTSLPRLHTVDDFPTLDALRDHWQQEEALMRGYLATLSDADLLAEMHYTDTKGTTQHNLRWQALVHLVLHGMQHRSETAALLTNYGHSPGWIDFILFVRERQT